MSTVTTWFLPRFAEHRRLREEAESLRARVRLLESESNTDPLTGLGNRRAFNRALDREMSRVDRGLGHPLSLLSFDLDHFKSVNDTHGHEVGDRVLQVLADILRERVRKTDFVGRTGGEEFMILMPATHRAGALVEALSIQSAIRAKLIVTLRGGMRVKCTASFGLVTLVREGDTCESPYSFLERADKALYKAKHEGRDRIVQV